MINNPKIILMVGLIGSGKSTHARKLVKHDLFLVRINKDNLRNSLLDVNPWSPEIECLISEVSISIAKTAINKGYSVVVDNTNTRISQRKLWFDLACECDIPLHIVHMTETQNNVKNRMTKPRGTTKSKWTSICYNMKRLFQDLTHEEKKKAALLEKIPIT